MRFLLIFSFFLFLIFNSVIATANIRVLTTIQPLYYIASYITHSTSSNVDILLSAKQSPHDIYLKPSHIKKINNADLLLYISDDLESFTPKLLQSTSSPIKVMQLITLPDIDVIYYQDHNDNDTHNHSHDHHGVLDPHIWLSPKNVTNIAMSLAMKLTDIDPDNRKAYMKNAITFSQNMQKKESEWKKRLKPYTNTPLLTLHNGYSYFSEFFSLTFIDPILKNSNLSASLKRINAINTVIKRHNIECLITDYTVDSKTVDIILQQNKIKVTYVDPLGTNIQSNEKNYFILMDKMVNEFIRCLE